MLCTPFQPNSLICFGTGSAAWNVTKSSQLAFYEISQIHIQYPNFSLAEIFYNRIVSNFNFTRIRNLKLYEGLDRKND